MEEKIIEIMRNINEDILNYTGQNMLRDGIIDSFELIEIVTDLEDAFDIEIDAGYVVEGHFKNKEGVIELMKILLSK